MITSERSEPTIAEDVQLMLQLEQGQLEADRVMLAGGALIWLALRPKETR